MLNQREMRTKAKKKLKTQKNKQTNKQFLSILINNINHSVCLYLNMSISESVPGPVSAIHTKRQTVTRHPVVTVIHSLSRHFGYRSFPPKVDLQPLVAVVIARTPCPSFIFRGNFV